jgi:cytochrome c biogenesis protein CcmG, thiol:disulfide interchange protein DsbE
MTLQRTIRTLTAIAAVTLLSATGCDRNERPEQLGRTAPTFSLNDGQQSVDLGKLRGHVVLLNFWATWCAPCLQEIPSLEAMQQELPQVQVVAVDFDDDAEAYQHFLKRRPVQLLTVFDSTQKSNTLYGTFRPPESYIIDKTGVIRRKFIGPQDWTSPEIVNFLKKLAA